VILYIYPLTGAIFLSLALILFMRVGRKFRQECASSEDNQEDFNCDKLAGELGALIFAAEDYDFVASESRDYVSRMFAQERKALGLEWLHGVRRQVNGLFRAHLTAARKNTGLMPAVEFRLATRFFTFQVITGIIDVVIRAAGPIRAAKLMALSLDLSERLLQTAQDLVPNPETILSGSFTLKASASHSAWKP
jgi:hypothetical protein